MESVVRSQTSRLTWDKVTIEFTTGGGGRYYGLHSSHINLILLLHLVWEQDGILPLLLLPLMDCSQLWLRNLSFL